MRYGGRWLKAVFGRATEVGRLKGISVTVRSVVAAVGCGWICGGLVDESRRRTVSVEKLQWRHLGL